MEYQCFSPLSFCCFDQEEEVGELRQALMYTALELQTTIITAKEEIAKRELELVHLKDVLSKTIEERDDAQAKCRQLEQWQEPPPLPAPSTGAYCNCIEDNESKDSRKMVGLNDNLQIKSSSLLVEEQEELKLEVKKPLPEQGKLLKAVMEAGPLLQILMLAGELPKWQQPPPQLHSIEVPPMAVSSPPVTFLRQDSSKSITSSSSLGNKRAVEFCESPPSKHQKLNY